MFEGLKKKFSNFVDSFAKKEKEEISAEEQKEVHPAPQPVAHNAPEIKAEQKREPVGETVLKVPPEKLLKTGKTLTDRALKGGERSPYILPSAVRKDLNEARKNNENTRSDEIRKEQAGRESAKVTFGTKLKGLVLRGVRVSDKDVEPFLEELKMSLLESDVNYDVTEKITDRMYKNLVEKTLTSNGMERQIRALIRASILEVLSNTPGPDVVTLAREAKASGNGPLRVMFLGPNGAGKTTTIAKFASMMKSSGLMCVLAASDTFRAAAIEQIGVHGDRIGVKVIKGTYGADPASIAFDAIAYAKAHDADIVLIDTAGRQETNKSLMEEMRKINRVAKPDLKIFIGESISGNALLDQVREFDTLVKLDGVILTKLDVDAKGGNTISILSETTVPIMFFGTGEKYGDLMPYEPEFIVNNVLPENN